MRYAIISDVHSNLEALKAVVKVIDSIGVDDIVCLGDVVGYNAEPDKCVSLMMEKGIRCVLGNHDSRVSGIEDPHDFNPAAKEAIYWTRRNISKESLAFLKALPRRLTVDGAFLAIHGWVDDTDKYVQSLCDVNTNFDAMEQIPGVSKLCFFGHTHRSTAYSRNDKTIVQLIGERISIPDGRSYLINPGSVGQPRDMNWRASFLIYDSDAKEVQFFRAEYDVDRTYTQVMNAGLPPIFAERLMVGS